MVSSRINTRSLLVLFQFSITITLIIFSIAIQQQLHYVKTKDIGFNRENIAITYLDSELLHSKFDVIKNDLLNYPNVINISKSVFNANNIFAPGPIRIEGENGIVTIPSMNRNRVDHEFIALNSIEIIKGRDFSVELTSDLKNAVIINETAAKIAGLKNPIGKKFASRDKEFDRTVIGVVKDFHFTSLKMDILPLALILAPDNGSRVSIKIKGVNTSETLKFIESVFMAQDKDHIFEYEFLDDAFNARYNPDQKMGNLLTTFSMVTIFIAVMGLVGLITYTVEQSTKQIGIRKALGASVKNIITLLSRNFLVILALSNIIAWPIGYYVVTRWLREFAYKIDLGSTPFIYASILVLVVAFITTSFQTIKSARANPVESLRYE